MSDNKRPPKNQHKRRPAKNRRPSKSTGSRPPRPGRPPGRRPPSDRRDETPFHPRPAKHLRPVLQEIGVPETRPFTPDPYQLEALEKLSQGDVVVSVPTGAGKTWVAVQAMADQLAQGGRSWYASPLKALSNSKYIEFCGRYGEENVGLLTGDHKVNPDAPIVVGTTEILRNQLYDAMTRGESLASNLVVMDEAHYLGDEDRGVVWEEVIIYLPQRIRLLLLSATVDNADEIAGWLGEVRGTEAFAVIDDRRPVPLHPVFMMPDGELVSLIKGKSLNPQIRHYMEQRPFQGRRNFQAMPPFGRVLRLLGETNLLPSIFFLKSRSDCDLALTRSESAHQFMDPDRRRRLTERLDEFLEKYPFLRGHPHLKYLYGPGVAAHHAGHLPHWKLVIEQLMQEGLLTAIFSTSTVAAGVNFPARTVVISQSDRFNGREFVDLTATDLLQMTGRAGRRGMDRIGFALFVPGPFMDPMLIHRLFSARPEPVESRIHINFSMTLNLLSSHRPDQIQPLLDRSLAAYQYDRARREDEAREIFDQVEELLTDRACGGPEEAFSLYNTSRRLKLEAKALKRQRPSLVWETALAAGLTPGRLFETTSGQPFVVLERKQRRGRAGVSAAKLREDLGLKKGRVRQKWVPLSGIDTLYDTVLDFSPKDKPGRVVQMVRDAASEEHQPLAKEDLPRDEADSRLADLDRRLDRISQDLDRLPCSDCPAYAHCQGREAREAQRLYHRLLNAEAAGQSAGGMLYSSFLQHMDFLKMEGYITEDGDLTDDGLWAARLRLDHPILIGEGIRADAWPVYDPGLLAAAVAPFVMDREIETDLPPQKAPPSLTQAWLRLETAVAPLKERLQAAGFDSARLYFRPAMAIYAWAEEGDWSRAVDLYGQDPGDMAMLVFRSADNLRQMAGLADTHPELADAARRAVDMILKEPVTIPL